VTIQDRLTYHPSAERRAGGRWYPPPPEETEEYSWVWPLPQGDLLRARCEVDHRCHIAFFAIMHLCRWHGRIVQVARADTCHEIVHIHQLAVTGREIGNTPIRVIQAQQDVEDGYDIVLDLMERRWAEHKRTWELALMMSTQGAGSEP
jgi:hypothetical protein